MPASAPRTAGGTVTGHEQLLRRWVSSTSPFHKDDCAPPPRPDTSKTARCTECGKRFVGTVVPAAEGAFARTAEEHLQAHIETEHGPKHGPPKGTPRTADGAAAIERVRATLTIRITSGELRPGQVVSLSQLTGELGVSRHFTDTAVTQLIAEGRLARTGADSAYSRVVVRAA